MVKYKEVRQQRGYVSGVENSGYYASEIRGSRVYYRAGKEDKRSCNGRCIPCTGICRGM